MMSPLLAKAALLFHGSAGIVSAPAAVGAIEMAIVCSQSAKALLKHCILYCYQYFLGRNKLPLNVIS